MGRGDAQWGGATLDGTGRGVHRGGETVEYSGVGQCACTVEGRLYGKVRGEALAYSGEGRCWRICRVGVTLEKGEGQRMHTGEGRP